MRCHRCGCVKVSIFLSKEPHFAQKRGSECHVHRCTMGFARFEAQRLAQFSGFSIRVWNSEELIRKTHTTGWGRLRFQTCHLGTLVRWPRPCTSCTIYSQQQFEDLLKAVCQTDPLCSPSTWKLLTRHTAFYIASCQLHSSEVPIVVSCLQQQRIWMDMACLEIRPLCQLHPRSTVQKPLQMKLGHLPERFYCRCLW